MTNYKLFLASFLVTYLIGCASHMHFVEESHFGLKARFGASSTTPYELDLGYRRGMIAAIPLQSEDKVTKADGTVDQKVEETEKKAKDNEIREQPVNTSNDLNKQQIIIRRDKNELMSLYCVFRANIGFNDPVEIYHFLATGRAAVDILSNHEELREIFDLPGTATEGPKE